MNVTDVNNNLKIISDAKSLHLKEFAWTYVLPVTCLVGFVANVINIYVFLQLKPDRLNKYCLIHSISYLLYTFFCFFSFLIRCGSLCQTGSTYFAKLYEYIVFNYMTSVLAIFSILIESCISFERYLLVTNGYFKSSSGKKLKFKYVLFILIVFSLLFYVPSVFTEEILQNRDNTTGLIKYSLELSQFGRSSQGTSVLIFLSAIRNLILLIINLIINLFTVMAFRRYIKNRQKIRIPSTKSETSSMGNGSNSNDEKSNTNLTYMIFYIFINYLIGNLPYAIIFILSHLFSDWTYFFVAFRLFANFMLFAHIIIITFIYYHFNKAYRQVFRVKILRQNDPF